MVLFFIKYMQCALSIVRDMEFELYARYNHTSLHTIELQARDSQQCFKRSIFLR